MRKRILSFLIILLYITGVVVFALPDINYVRNSWANRQEIDIFETQASDQGQEDSQETSGKGQEEQRDTYNELYTQMQTYNQKIYIDKQSGLSDPWSFESGGIELGDFGVENDVVAVIKIPKMDVELPVYLGATEENMSRGAVQLGQTSMPVGGENTNCVIAAHRGYKGIPMFREIERLEEGDEVILTNLWETLVYKVSEIKIIYPSDIQEILIRPGKDLVTLLTCHPYTHNYERYVVICERQGSEADSLNEVSGQNSGKIETDVDHNSEETRKRALSEDSDTLFREKILRYGGYIFLGVVGVLIILKLFCRDKKLEKDISQRRRQSRMKRRK